MTLDTSAGDVTDSDLSALGDGHADSTAPDATAADRVLPADVLPDTGVDVPVAAGDCQQDTDCPAGLYCLLPDELCVACVTFEHCDDGNPCTFDYCAEAHECIHNPIEGACDDGNSCTSGETCQAGACVPAATIPCFDGNPCTDDVCPDGVCSFAANTAACDDGDPCTVGDVCVQAACQPGAGQLACGDGNPCTTDACVPMQGCVGTPAEGACDDANSCTSGDHCENGQCMPTAVVPCDDGDPCTKDECAPDGSCSHVPAEGAECTDGNACTAGESCLADGSCGGGYPSNCDDGNPCTQDGCDAALGCQNAVLDKSPCDDGNPCTSGDTCALAVCTGVNKDCSDNNPCTIDGCLPSSGQCINEPFESPCDDGNPCTAGDSCQGGQCVPGPQPGCDDGNPCTQDLCDPASGCVNPAQDGGGCDDGNPCTQGDTCANGACQGQPIGCDDANPCTEDVCQGGACVYNPIPGCASCVNSGCGYIKEAPCHCDSKCYGYQDCCGDVCTFCQHWFCPCMPSCEGKECGNNGCGQSCGGCPDWHTCWDNKCIGI
jgi:hypothetical protein